MLDDAALRTLFLDARTPQGFSPEPLPRELLQRIVELAELGPTSNNSLPMRLLFVQSPEAKSRLLPALSEGNVGKTRVAPVTAIVAVDLAFYDHFPERFESAARFKERYAGPDKAEAARAFATMNATLQGAYLMLAARALGVAAGPMGGFDRALVDAAFLRATTYASLWLCNLGYSDGRTLRPRAPRLSFDEVASIV